MAVSGPRGPEPAAASAAVSNTNAGWTRLVLETYTQTMARSRDERGAFDAAVAIYRSQNPDASEQEARRGVAVLLCGEG